MNAPVAHVACRRIEVKGVNGVRLGVAPVHGAAVRAPSQSVRHGDAVGLAHQLAAGAVAVQRCQSGVARFVDRADPEAALRIALAVVEALAGRVVGWCGQPLAPAGGGVETPQAVAHRQQQAAVQHWRATGHFGVEVPVHQLARDGVEALQLAARDVAPVEHLLDRVPHRRLTQQRRRLHRHPHRRVGHPLARHQITATSSFIQASKVSPAARLRSPCASGSAMWIAFDTWLTGSTQK